MVIIHPRYRDKYGVAAIFMHFQELGWQLFEGRRNYCARPRNG